MGKEVYVRDAIESCLDCKFCIEICEGGLEACCGIMTDENDKSLYREIEDYCQSKPDWCPFKPLPEKDRKSYTDNSGIAYKRGWNACIDAISREE